VHRTKSCLWNFHPSYCCSFRTTKLVHPNDHNTSAFIYNQFIQIDKIIHPKIKHSSSHFSSKSSFIRLSSFKITSIHSESPSILKKDVEKFPRARGSLALFPVSPVFPCDHKSSLWYLFSTEDHREFLLFSSCGTPHRFLVVWSALELFLRHWL
jgi:hypothetical protein